jgi:hypothetical protein
MVHYKLIKAIKSFIVQAKKQYRNLAVLTYRPFKNVHYFLPQYFNGLTYWYFITMAPVPNKLDHFEAFVQFNVKFSNVLFVAPRHST